MAAGDEMMSAMLAAWKARGIAKAQPAEKNVTPVEAVVVPPPPGGRS